MSPKIAALYRKGEFGLDAMMAFAITDDHAAQKAAWDALRHCLNPHSIRAYLTREVVPPTDKLARFVGVDAYVEASGAIMRDLFNDENEAYLTERPLLLRLAAEKLDAAMEALRTEGRKWVSAEMEPNHGIHYEYLSAFPREDDDEADRYAPRTSHGVERCCVSAMIALSPSGEGWCTRTTSSGNRTASRTATGRQRPRRGNSPPVSSQM